MKLTQCLTAAFALTLFLAAPLVGRADNLKDELLDATHDMRAHAELRQEVIPAWETPVFTIDDTAPGLDVGTVTIRVTSLEDLSGE